MPNWCSTNITIYNENKEENENFARLMKEWTSKNYRKNGFGLHWLGNIVLGAEIGTVDTDPQTDLRCRGSLCYWDYDNDTFTFQTETAWVPMLLMWRKLIDKYMPEAEIIYSAEEPGFCIYDTNDPTIAGSYFIDVWHDLPIDIESAYSCDEEDVKDILSELLNDYESSIDRLMEKFKESEYRDSISINIWKYADEELYY